MIEMNPPPCPATEIFCSPKMYLCKNILCAPQNQLFNDIEIKTEINMQQNETSCESVCRRKRKVRFAPPCFMEYPGTVSNDPKSDEKEEEGLDLWWSQEEIDTIMAKAQLIATEARDQPIVTGGLDQALHLALTKASLFREQSQLEEHLQKIQEEHRGLKLWCQYGHSRRGLEKFTSLQYNDMRKKQIYKLSKMVLILTKKRSDPELVRQVSEQTSRASVVFARMLAIADYNTAISLTIGEDDDLSKAAEGNKSYPRSA